MNNKKLLFSSLIAILVIIALFGCYKIFIAKNNPSLKQTPTSANVVLPEKIPTVASESPANVSSENTPSPVPNAESSLSAGSTSPQPAQTSAQYATNISLVGPKGNVPSGAPKDDSLKLFAVPVPGVLSRSGQPTLAGFQWLKKNGWKSVIDFREDGEKSNPYALDSKLPGFNALGLNFLSLSVKDSTTPSLEQADQFLKFVTDPKNQPAHVHCAAGIGRTGIAVALYRYSVQSWPMDKAVEEAGLFTKNMNKSQQSWLQKWAASHAPGSYKQ